MPKQQTKGTAQLATEIDAELAAAVRQFAKARRETLREVLELALRRHMANPPPIQEPPPLPPFPSAPKKRGKGK